MGLLLAAMNHCHASLTHYLLSQFVGSRAAGEVRQQLRAPPTHADLACLLYLPGGRLLATCMIIGRRAVAPDQRLITFRLAR
jgi:hypothetical protein